jgi:hypothetical protein
MSEDRPASAGEGEDEADGLMPASQTPPRTCTLRRVAATAAAVAFGVVALVGVAVWATSAAVSFARPSAEASLAEAAQLGAAGRVRTQVLWVQVHLGGIEQPRLEAFPIAFPLLRSRAALAAGACRTSPSDSSAVGGLFPTEADDSGTVDCSPTGAELAAALAGRLGVHPALLSLRIPAPVNGAPHSDSGSTVQPLLLSESLLAQGVGGGSVLQARLRPLRGDHLHSAFALYVRGARVTPASLTDRPVTPTAISEGGHVMQVSGEGGGGESEELQHPRTSLHTLARPLQLFPHFGVHGGGAGWFDDG